MATISVRGALAAYLALTLGVVAIIATFVLPGVAVTHCSVRVELSTSPGRSFCSETVALPRTSSGCSQGNATVSGPAVVRDFSGFRFQAHTFAKCIGISNLGFNASVVQPNHGVFNVTDWGFGVFVEWFNWTSPDNQSGLQWRGNYTLALLVAE
jgi:hypothetical protein